MNSPPKQAFAISVLRLTKYRKLSSQNYKASFVAKLILSLWFSIVCAISAKAQNTEVSTIANNGWASNSVNAVIFRKNSLVTFRNHQYAAYYDSDQFVVLAKRLSGARSWQIQRTQYKGDATDAHKSISIIVDGSGFLHVAWGQHNNDLNYAKTTAPGSLQLGEKSGMLSDKENKVSYPEFYKLPGGDLLFFYRDGGSGNGNLMINRYSVKSKTWQRIQDGMINGEGKRNAYWQVALDRSGVIHLSWVWRESPDVSSNHDLCYAKSLDGGLTWQKSTGERCQMPIVESNAEYALKIPQKSDLINQTSMYADESGNVFIASYWRGHDDDVPQFHIVFNDGQGWRVNSLSSRKTTFSLGGGGTKKIPVSRPQILIWRNHKSYAAGVLFRDAERGSKVSLAINQDIQTNQWQIQDLTSGSVGDWEPSYDTELWKDKKILNLYLQNVIQIDGEGITDMKPSAVKVLQWKPKIKR